MENPYQPPAPAPDVAHAPGSLILIGRGRLTWDASERRCDRYGYVYLINSGDSLSSGTDYAAMVVRPKHVGLRATLRAKVTEARQSTHIGDLFHGVFPTTPEVGDIITLGTGLLSKGRNCDGRLTVGLKPFDDERETMWLDIKALYRCHEQTVELMYEPLEEG